jgi:ribose transport system ATP-binding protein
MIETALSTRGLTKSFAGRAVLSDLDYDVHKGEVHALLGQNGSGKSTLIKCLAGVYRPESGEISVGGRVLPSAYPPSAAKRFGLAFVHQDLGLALNMTIADNLGIGRGFHTVGPLVRGREQNDEARRILDFLGVKATPQTLVRDLPVTARTLVAIGRAIDLSQVDRLSCLVLDEPTAALPDSDAHLLFDAIRQLTKQGVGVVYVSHRLEEIERLADRVTVLRDGRKIGTHAIADITRKALVDEILGERDAVRTTAAPVRSSARPRDPGAGPALRAESLTGVRVQDVSLSLRAGEIVGLAGLAGSGRSELCRLLFGAQRLESGRIWIGGEELRKPSPARSIRRGVAYIPEDRRGAACLLRMTVRENLTLLRPPVRRGLIDRARERRAAKDAIARFDVRPSNSEALVSSLSGGNQQKVMLAKWFENQPGVIILDEPVQGVDVGAKAQVFEHLTHAAARGAAVLVVDSDFENLTQLCSRVLILRHGVLAGELTGDAIETSAITHATFGVSEEADHVALNS